MLRIYIAAGNDNDSENNVSSFEERGYCVAVEMFPVPPF
jgi:hypothetical protein